MNLKYLFFCHILLLLKLEVKQFQKISPESIVGDIEHSVEVINGDAVVKVPIPKLKGINNLVPQIDLIYKSSQYLQNKEIGLGWSFNGLTEISRCFKNFANDDEFDTIKYNNSDRLCLDGQRLILTKGNYGIDQSEYKTEIETYKRIVLYSDNEILGPKYFEIFTKNNLIMTYGFSNNSTTSHLGAKVVNKWLLNKIEDYVGNCINYTYSREGDYTYLSNIRYSNKMISFSYVDRIDVQTKYFSAKLDMSIKKILKNIVLSVFDSKNFTEIKRFEMQYTQVGPAKLSLLKLIKLCYPDGSCTLPLLFKYDGETGETERFDRVIYQQNICSVSTVCELKQVADMNGDGKMDIVGFGSDGVFVSINMGTYFNKSTRWTSEFTTSTGWTATKHLRYIADVDNDGLPDLVGFGENGVFVGLNIKNGFKSSEKWHDQFGYSPSSGSWFQTNVRYLLDINNDGFLDIIGFLNGYGLIVSYGNGKSFLNYIYQTTLNANPVFNGPLSTGYQ